MVSCHGHGNVRARYQGWRADCLQDLRASCVVFIIQEIPIASKKGGLEA
jgi:hypothetical protein